MLTLQDIETLMPLIDAGIRAVGIKAFQNDGGIKLQSVLAKLQQMAEQPRPPTASEDTPQRQREE